MSLLAAAGALSRAMTVVTDFVGDPVGLEMNYNYIESINVNKTLIYIGLDYLIKYQCLNYSIYAMLRYNKCI